MMGTLSTQILLVLLVLLVHSRYATASNSSNVGKPKIKCMEYEKRALLSIKEQLYDASSLGQERLSSWGNEEGKEECCKWLGIQCDIDSGHVIELDFSPSTFHTEFASLRGTISPSLFELQHLTYLDLSHNYFHGSPILSSIDTLSQLRYLNLSQTSLDGEIPPQLGNVSSLHVLDLSFNSDLTTNLEWLSGLSSLRNLDLSHVNLSRANNWMQVFNELPSLKNLQLAHCNLPNNSRSPPSLSFVNSSISLAVLDLSENDLSASIYIWLFNFSDTLVHLDLSSNQLEGSIPEDFFNMTTLAFLDLSSNQLEGSIAEAFGKMTSLTYLDLSSNKLNSSIPEDLGKMTSLTYLDLGGNMLEGEIPKSIWNISMLHALSVYSNNLTGDLSKSTFSQLKHLEVLDLSGNAFQGVISEAHFSNLSKLRYLDLSLNSLTLTFHPDWIPPFRLNAILLGSCKLGPVFPKWLQSQKNYSYLDISNTGISDSVPNWFWDLSNTIEKVDLSNNQITGEIGNRSVEFQENPVTIDLSTNHFEGSVPSFLFGSRFSLNLSQNGLSNLDLLCNINADTHLRFLDISNNKISGKLPDCWSHFIELHVLILTNNKLSGKVPSSIGSLTMIMTLQLTNNNFTGELPSTLMNCQYLIAIDFGENKLSGPIPKWIGESFPNLIVLSLRSNLFRGSMPSNIFHLSSLQVLDLSLNKISGGISNDINSFAAMKKKSTHTGTSTDIGYTLGKDGEPLISKHFYQFAYRGTVQLQWKGKLTEIRNILGLVKTIDLSSNKLMGAIPGEIADLVELVSLNLSRNYLSGEIPSDIGQLRSLEVLDFSRNHLVGQIPSSLAQIDRLNTFDVSNNNFSGKIPTSTQLQSFPSTAYMGNPFLCGDPLPDKCRKDEELTSSGDDDKLFTRGFYISMAIGFAVSFWIVSGTLIFHKSFRSATNFKFLNDAGDFIYVRAAIYKGKILRIIKS